MSAQWKDFSLRALAQSLAGAKPGWMLTLMMYALSILVVGIELVSRSVSFYICVLLCGLIVLLASRRNIREPA